MPNSTNVRKRFPVRIEVASRLGLALALMAFLIATLALLAIDRGRQSQMNHLEKQNVDATALADLVGEEIGDDFARLP